MLTISSDNFYVKENHKNFYELGYIEEKDKITILNTHFCMPQFYFKKDKNGWILTTKNISNIKLSHEDWIIDGIAYRMLNCDQSKLKLNCQIINNYSKIEIYKNGEIKITPFDFSKLYSVPIEKSIKNIQGWYSNIANIVDKFYEEGKFIPTLTGGCDTRILTYFWRDKDIKQYLCHGVKRDGTNNIENGAREIKIAKSIINKFGKNMERLEDLPSGCITFSGTWTDNVKFSWMLDDKRFIMDVVNRCFSFNSICPFLDDNYLMIKSNTSQELRCLFLMIFCPDLLDFNFPFVSGSNKPTYRFYEKFNDELNIFNSCKDYLKKFSLYRFKKGTNK